MLAGNEAFVFARMGFSLSMQREFDDSASSSSGDPFDKEGGEHDTSQTCHLEHGMDE
jgi:hypothetical protein